MTAIRFFSTISLIIISVSCIDKSSGLKKGNWNPGVYRKLDSVIVADGIHGCRYDIQRKPYAVFDFDNTSIMNDCEISLMHYMISHMSFKIAPEEMFRTITCTIPHIDSPVIGNSTVRMIAEDIADDYRLLYGKKFSEIESSDVYKDFKAKLSALYFVTENHYEYKVCCEWILKLFNGLSTSELTDLVTASFDYNSALKKIVAVNWESPEMGRCGKILSTHYEGIVATEEMRELYATLRKNGFDVYICSASLETIVETIACDEKSGFCMSPEYVYGLRLSDDGDRIVDAVLDPEYTQTFRQGKSDAIRKYISPLHGGRGPSLVGGDSNGDYNMLTDFDDMKAGLIIDCGNGGGIGELVSGGDPKYAVQKRDLSTGRFVH